MQFDLGQGLLELLRAAPPTVRQQLPDLALNPWIFTETVFGTSRSIAGLMIAKYKPSALNFCPS